MWLSRLLEGVRGRGGKKGQKNRKSQQGGKDQKPKHERSKSSDTPATGQPPSGALKRPVPTALAALEARGPAKGPKKAESKKVEEQKDEPPKFERAKGKKSELRVSPKAWAHLIWLRDRGDTEISVFGLSRLNDLLYVHDVKLIKQQASGASFEFDDEALNDYLFDMVKEGYQPVECLRIWIHTHPGGSSPSSTDKATFDKTTAEADWGIMCIVGSDGDTSARLRIGAAGRQYDVALSVVIDWTGPFEGVDEQIADAWEKEYQECVKKTPSVIVSDGKNSAGFVMHDCRSYHREVQDHYDRRGYGYDDYDNYSREDHGPGAWCNDSSAPQSQSQQQQTMAERGVPSSAQSHADTGEWYRFAPKEMIHLIEDDIAKGTTTVWTDRYWFAYEMEAYLLADEGHEIEELLDICMIEPLMWGESVWGVDKNGDPVHKAMSCYAETKFTVLEAYNDSGIAEQKKARELKAAEKKEDAVGEEAQETGAATASEQAPVRGP